MNSSAPPTFLPLGMTWDRAITVFLMIFGMCAVAGLPAMRKLRDANPADMFSLMQADPIRIEAL
jgi:putative ABC transport system permease protein